ncbi:glutathione S-transferase family protein [Allofustis seminis]|uniref:glutathione S-transferase family protein n=1 Tax=Allofustis seminis TaxID=166939 RepID=UPI00036F219F|nr:glutathione S-transferase family protein [Allofustis seminis]
MGLLVNGKWQDKWYDTQSSGGRFVRGTSSFRNWITKDGSAGPTGKSGFKAEKGRYHLYVSLACPWAHRTLLIRALKGLEAFISISVVHPHMGEQGWSFEPGDGVIADPVLHADYLHQIYTHVDPQFTGRVTVPVLYDLKQDTIVNNESSEIIRMLNTAFDDLGAVQVDFYPDNLQEEIDALNATVYEHVNNGVYKAGFATEQHVYEEEVYHLFKTLDTLEERLNGQDYLFGNILTEADIRLWTTLLRFDPVYFGHFKCNIRELKEYPNLWHFTRLIYNMPGVKETVNMEHIQRHYYTSHDSINPNRIIPVGPVLDYSL